MKTFTPLFKITHFATRTLILLALVLAGLSSYQSVQAGGLCYVDGSASGTNDGSSWTDAYTDLQSALGDVSCTEIWTAAGAYLPDGASPGDRTLSFVLPSGVAVYGGFAGTESMRSQRDLTANITILSGDISVSNVSLDNSYHVVDAGGADSTSVLDGFTITLGHADGSDPDNYGGGMYNHYGSPVLANLIFSDNYASTGGGGMYNVSTFPAPELTNVTFDNNSAGTFGGGMYNTSSSPTLTDVTFNGNHSSLSGGGMTNSVNAPTLTNVTFYNNSAATNGGAMSDTLSSPSMTNVTFSGNSAGTLGGGMYNTSSSNPVIYDGIFWDDGTEIYVSGDSTLTVTDSIIQGGCPTGGSCTNVIDSDPLLGLLQDNGGETETMALGPGSPAIDAGGVNSTCAADDQRGISRPQGSTCDIGAFEVKILIVTKTADTDDGTCDSDCSLREAINDADPGTVTFALSGTFTLGSALPHITSAITIDGSGYDVIMDGADTYRLFYVESTGDLTLDNVTLINGFDSSYGGALAVDQGMVTISDSTISGNNVSSGPGGAIAANNATVVISNSTLVDNHVSSASSGGAIYNLGAMTIVNSTLSDNSSGTGGAIGNGSILTVINSTFSGNSAASVGGGIFNQNSATLNLTNTILANSTSGVDCYNQPGDTIDTNSNNLIETNGPSGHMCGSPAVTADPKLDNLADNGGPTQTMALLVGSPAFYAGDDVACAAAPVNGLAPAWCDPTAGRALRHRCL